PRPPRQSPCAAACVNPGVGASLSHGSDCFWQHKGSGKPRFENENAGPQLSAARVSEREYANKLPGADSKPESENAGRGKHRRRKPRGETSVILWTQEQQRPR